MILGMNVLLVRNENSILIVWPNIALSTEKPPQMYDINLCSLAHFSIRRHRRLYDVLPLCGHSQYRVQSHQAY